MEPTHISFSTLVHLEERHSALCEHLRVALPGWQKPVGINSRPRGMAAFQPRRTRSLAWTPWHGLHDSTNKLWILVGSRIGSATDWQNLGIYSDAAIPRWAVGFNRCSIWNSRCILHLKIERTWTDSQMLETHDCAIWIHWPQTQVAAQYSVQIHGDILGQCSASCGTWVGCLASQVWDGRGPKKIEAWFVPEIFWFAGDSPKLFHVVSFAVGPTSWVFYRNVSHLISYAMDTSTQSLTLNGCRHIFAIGHGSRKTSCEFWPQMRRDFCQPRCEDLPSQAWERVGRFNHCEGGRNQGWRWAQATLEVHLRSVWRWQRFQWQLAGPALTWRQGGDISLLTRLRQGPQVIAQSPIILVIHWSMRLELWGGWKWATTGGRITGVRLAFGNLNGHHQG